MAEEWLDLDWWEAALQIDMSIQAYSPNQGYLGVAFGDGSGSGMGRTVQLAGGQGWSMPDTGDMDGHMASNCAFLLL